MQSTLSQLFIQVHFIVILLGPQSDNFLSLFLLPHSCHRSSPSHFLN